MLIPDREIPIVQLLGRNTCCRQQVSFAIHLSQLEKLTKLVKFPTYLGCFCIFLTEHRVETSYV